MNLLISLLKSAWTSLTINKLRTFLTLLGIVIGILSVITLLNLGEAAQKYIEDQVSSIGSNLIAVTPGRIQSSNGFNLSALTNTFPMSDIDAVMAAPKTFISGVSTSASGMYKAQYGANVTTVSTTGVYGDYWAVRNVVVESGQEITMHDNTAITRVAVVGPDLITSLFNGVDPIGKKFKLNNLSFTVIGVTKAQGAGGFGTSDSGIFVPLVTMQKMLSGSDKVSAFTITAKDAKLVDAAQSEIEQIMRRIHGLKEGDPADFTIRNTGQALTILDQITGVLTAFLAAIGAISLLVGGIGIMNIMFVTVNERTKEIGLRKSLGATKNDILLQFLAEAVVVTMLGGILGTLLGLALTWLITSVAGLSFVVNFGSVSLAVGVSVVIGLVFGIYPAWKAAQLSPIDALRYE